MPSNGSASGTCNRVGDAARGDESQCRQCSAQHCCSRHNNSNNETLQQRNCVGTVHSSCSIVSSSIPSVLVDDEEDEQRIISYVGSASVTDTGGLSVARPVLIKDPSLAQVQRITTTASADLIASPVSQERDDDDEEEVHDNKVSKKK